MGGRKLTEREIESRYQQALENAQQGKRTKIGCGCGLILSVNAMTTKGKVRAVYTSRAGTKDVVIGEYKRMSLANAFKAVEKLKGQKQEEKAKALDLPTFKEFWFYDYTPQYFARVGESRQANVKTFYNQILHVLDDFKLDELTINNVSNALKEVDTTIKNKFNAIKVLQLAMVQAELRYQDKGFINYLVNLHKLDEFKNVPKKQHFLSINASELKDLYFEPLKNQSLKARVYYLFVCLTALRPKEGTLNLKWDYVDFKKSPLFPYGAITIPAEDMKIKKNSFTFPLTKYTAGLLTNWKSAQKVIGECPYIFNQNRDITQRANHNEFDSPLKVLGITSYMKLHGLRSTFSSYMNEQGFNRDYIDKCLAHEVGNSVSQAYNRAQYFKQMYEIFEYWHQFVYEQLPDEFKELLNK